MHKPLASLAAALLLGAAACSRTSAPSNDLSADLSAANGGSLELAPRIAGTQVVSDLEQTPRATPRATPARTAERAPVPQPVRRAARATPAPAPQAVAAAPQDETPAPVAAPQPQPEIIATPRPTPAPQPASAPRGGYRSVSDVIRNAPFPITP